MEAKEIIKKVILDIAKRYGIEIDRIILFGSRARGDYRKNSDWDILIVTKEKLDKKVLEDIYYDISFNLIDLLENPVDVLIIDKKTYELKKGYKGFVYHWATVEGKTL